MLGAHNRKAMVTLTTFKSLEQGQTLFDFATPINEDNFIINETSEVYRKKVADVIRYNNLMVISKQKAMNGDLPDFQFESLFKLKMEEHGAKAKEYVIDKSHYFSEGRSQFPSISELEKMPYICMNNNGRINETKSSVIKKGDCIKLGRSYFQVTQTHLSQSFASRLPEYVDPLQLQNRADSLICEVAKTCRICLMEDSQELISPCRCKGSCEFVHSSCLMTWLQNKVTRTDNRLVSVYSLAKFECQLCKQSLPNNIMIGEREVNFVEFKRPDEPYIIIEKIEENPRQRTIYVITPQNQMIKFGRSPQCDIRLQDQTLSRMHSQIEFRNGQFYIWDMGSKFGTLLLLKEPVPFSKAVCLQFGNRIYKWEIKSGINGRAYEYL